MRAKHTKNNPDYKRYSVQLQHKASKIHFSSVPPFSPSLG